MSQKITELLGKKIVVCDGAMGTMMQRHGLKPGGLPELLSFTDPEIIKEIHRNYYQAGSDFVSANTFGCNRYKLANSGYTVLQVVTEAVKLAKEAAQEAIEPSALQGNLISDKFVALDVGPIGKLMAPAGDLTFDEAYDIFKEVVVAGEKAGADFVLFETFIDIYEMKAAVLAAKENSELPVFCSVTFQKNGRMLMGSDPLTAVSILQDLGIDALGVNCSLGPKEMIGIVKEFLACSKLPVLVQPNAGLPALVDGEAVYSVDVSEYVEAMREMLRAGVAIAGGCCGTNPDYIAALSKLTQAEDFPALQPDADKTRKRKAVTSVSCSTKTVVFNGRVRIIGERINPTGKILLTEALKTKNFSYIKKEAASQAKAGADILDVNVWLPDIDELEMMIEVIKKISLVNVPLSIDSADPGVIEAAARYYNGKPLINSVNGSKESMEAVFPIVKKYGACVIALTLDERGLPHNVEERLAIAERIIQTAETYGIGRKRILVDCLTLTASAQQNAGRDTLEAIRRIKKQYGVKTVLGVNNVSYGLPERKLLNGTFLAMALEAGLDAPITDPLAPEYRNVIHAFEVLASKDINAEDYVRIYGGRTD
ncbi:MAG TPA: homocysteine S-methyltransferase family protein [Anaerovoracaceae bacterium]|nr:homocysteine S-methyltransferase family protein [Anaerovoracaceae bacterium]